MSSESRLTGLAALAIVLAVPATVAVSALLLHLYRRRLTQLMGSTSGSSSLRSHADFPGTSQRRDLPPPHQLLADMGTTHWKVAGLYALSGTLTAVVMTVFLFVTEGLEFYVLRAAAVFVVYAWPVVVTTCLVAAESKRTTRALVLGYFAVCVLGGLLLPPASPSSSPWDLLRMWLFIQGPATLLACIVLHPRIRAVAPLILACALLCAIGANLALLGLEHNLRPASEVAFALGLGALSTFWLVALAGLAVFALISAPLLLALRRAYQRKLVSDQGIVLDTLWLLYCAMYGLMLVFGGGVSWFSLGVIGPFLTYRISAMVLFRLLGPRARPDAPRLLFLRVFALGTKTAPLWDALGKTVRHVASIRMIAGPDLAATTVEPHEFLDFLVGKFERRFITTLPDTLEDALVSIDDAPDADGRYRVNKLYCRDNTWQQTFARLLVDSDAVLMDVRAFSRERRGCEYELRHLSLGACQQ